MRVLPRFFRASRFSKDGIAALRIDTDGRLIEQKNLRIVKQSRRQIQTPLHASAERFHFVTGAIRESDQIQDVVDCLLCLRAGERVKRRKKNQIVAGGELVIKAMSCGTRPIFSLTGSVSLLT